MPITRVTQIAKKNEKLANPKLTWITGDNNQETQIAKTKKLTKPKLTWVKDDNNHLNSIISY